MQLYLDDKLVTPNADASALSAALARFKILGHARLGLHRGPRQRLVLSRAKFGGSIDELYVEVETPNSLEGATVGVWNDTATIARDYFEGKAVRLTWQPPPGFVEVVVGDAYHPDCPLCLAAKRKGS